MLVSLASGFYREAAKVAKERKEQRRISRSAGITIRRNGCQPSSSFATLGGLRAFAVKNYMPGL